MHFKILLPLMNLVYVIHAEKNKTIPTKIKTNLKIAWMEKPPYTVRLNSSMTDKPGGLLRRTVWQFIELGCDHYDIHIETVEVDNMDILKSLVQEGKVQVALPIFMDHFGHYGEYKGLPSVKVLDHPGLDFITTGKSRKEALHIVLNAILSSWPLLLITMLLTAIAGVIVWAVDSRWNREEFPRSFLQGSWEGFWWSFVSMTTVGYGDKIPKSHIARVVSIVWILTGVICMAIFVAHITSVLTSFTLDHDTVTIVGKKVAVLKNQSEYDWATEKGAKPIAYDTVNEMVLAVKTNEVEGILLDHYTAFYYGRIRTFASLFIAKKIEVQQQVSVIFAPELSHIVDCLSLIRPAIVSAVQAITVTYKLNLEHAPRNDALLKNVSPETYLMVYFLSGVLTLLGISGLLWEVINKKKVNQQIEQDPEAIKAYEMTRDVNVVSIDINEGQQLLEQLKDYIDRLQKKTQEKHKN